MAFYPVLKVCGHIADLLQTISILSFDIGEHNPNLVRKNSL